MMGLEKGTKYFYRTYAMNAEGVGYGVVKDFVTAGTCPRTQLGQGSARRCRELVDQSMVWLVLYE